jgi:hypothetical protein
VTTAQRLFSLLLLLGVSAANAGCAGGETDTPVVRSDTLSQRQRDSVIGQSRLPGAQGVRGALDAADAAAARAAAADSIGM